MTEQQHEHTDVIIIGGGFAGVTAMRDLRATGRSVLLLEARDRLGGRTWYRNFTGTDQLVEIGGTWSVDRRQPHIAAEKKRYGLGTSLSPRPQTWRMSLAGTVRDNWLPVEVSEVADFERGIYHLIHDSLRVDFGKPCDQQELDDLDISFEDWMESKNLSEQTRAFMSAFVGLNFGCTPEEMSALHLLVWIAGMGNSPWTLNTVLTEKFAKGTRSLIDAMTEDAGGADIRLSSPVARIEHDPDGVTVTTRSGEIFRAPTAVVATPVNTWKDVEFSPRLNEAKTEASARYHPGRSVKLWSLVKGAPSYFASWSGEGGLCWLSSEFEIAQGAVMVGFAHSPKVVDINDPADVGQKVKAFLPDEAEVIGVDGHDWNADEFSQGTWRVFPPGHLTSLHSGLMENEGRLVFAGSDIAPGWAGWMEGAIESGTLAAGKVNEIFSSKVD